jgi:hypothetical protein
MKTAQLNNYQFDEPQIYCGSYHLTLLICKFRTNDMSSSYVC